VDQQWYYVDSDGRNGPVSLRDLTTMLAKFPSAADVLVWREGQQEWTKAGDIPELASLTRFPPSLPDAASLQPPFWKVRWWWLIFAIGLPGAIGSRDGRRMMAWRSAERRRARRPRQAQQTDNALGGNSEADLFPEPASSSVFSSDRTHIAGQREIPSFDSSIQEPKRDSATPTKPLTLVRALSSGLNALLVLLTVGGGLLGVGLYIFMNASGPSLKVWTQEVYLDPQAKKPVLVLNIQSRDDTAVVLTSVSVNDDPKCFPEYNSSGIGGPINDQAALNNFTNGVMQIMLKSQGINILRTGYSRSLKLGEIEKLSLGSPSFGGCTPVKVVITTDHGSSTFNFN
jgi:GYF domain 2